MKQTAVKKVAAKKAVKKPATAAGKPVTVTLTKEDHYTPPAPSITIKAYSEELVNELLKKVQERPIERYDGAIAKTQSMDKPLSPTPKKMSELDSVISSISSSQFNKSSALFIVLFSSLLLTFSSNPMVFSIFETIFSNC